MPSQPSATNLGPTALQEAIAGLGQLSARLTVQRQDLSEAAELASQIRLSLRPRQALSTTASPPYLPPSPPGSSPSTRSHSPHRECLIHLGPIAEDEAFALPCGHVFCAECMGYWLRESDSCPTCRTGIHSYYRRDTSDYGDDHGPANGDSSHADIPSDSTSISPTDTEASSVPSSTSTSDPADRRLIEDLAFHHRMIAELELLVSRAECLIADGTEVVLNVRWVVFLQGEIERHEDAVEGLLDELLE